MKVLMLNGSPRKEGCTYTALIQIAGVLEKNGIESEIFQAGTPELENVRAAAEKMKEADALIVGSPVYWASPSGQIIEFMDKFCSLAGKDMLLKPAAAIASARRAGTTATLDVLLKYFSFHQMPIVSSNYWNMVHGNTPDEVLQDHACSRQKYGMASALSGSRKKCWNFKTGIRREGKDKLYPLNL